jgi:hypothetical protein
LKGIPHPKESISKHTNRSQSNKISKQAERNILLFLNKEDLAINTLIKERNRKNLRF